MKTSIFFFSKFLSQDLEIGSHDFELIISGARYRVSGSRDNRRDLEVTNRLARDLDILSRDPEIIHHRMSRYRDPEKVSVCRYEVLRCRYEDPDSLSRYPNTIISKPDFLSRDPDILSRDPELLSRNPTFYLEIPR